MFWKSITVALLVVFAASEAEGRPDRDRIREQLEFGLEVGEQFEIDGRHFNLNRVGRGKLGSKVIAGDNSENEFMILTEDNDGNFYGSVLIDGANYRVMPDGNLRKAGRVTGKDTVIRQVYPSDRPMAFDGGDNGIVDRWHNPGWQNTLVTAKNQRLGMWYTPESDRSITYVDVFVYWDQNIGGNPKPFIDAEFAKANEIFQRSGVYIRLNLVGYEVINMGVEKANTTLTKMDASQGVFRNINTVRQNSGADIIHTFTTEDTRRAMCGVAYLGGYKGRWNYRDNLSVSVCHGGETFVHEIAHIFGSDHDEANAGSGFHFWYSVGYNVRNQQGFDHISTVMSYGNAEVGVFSSPNLSCKGQACGLDEVSDNVRSLNHNRNWVAKANGPSNGNSVGTYVEPDTRDSDSDGVTDYYDTCPNTPYGAQVDTFGCELDNNNNNDDDDNSDTGTDSSSDADGDGYANSYDNCPNNYNPSQADNDGDGYGNVCDGTPDGDVTPVNPPSTLSGDYDVSSHGGICTRSRSVQHDYVVNFRGFQNNSNSGSVWALCPLSRGAGSSMVAAEVTILPITDSTSNYNVRCDLVEIYEGNVQDTISLSVNPGNTNLGQSTHVFDPVGVKDVNSSSFAIECQVPRGHAITGIRAVSGN